MSPARAGGGASGSASWTRRGSSSSTRPAPRPTWPGATAAARSASAWSRPCRMATGAPRPSSPGLRQSGIIAPLVLDGPLTGVASAPMGNSSSPRRARPATSWSSTTSPRTRSPASARRSPPPVARSSTCRRTRPTSTRSTAARGRRAHQRGTLVDHRRPPRRGATERMCQLPQPLPLWFHVKRKRFSCRRTGSRTGRRTGSASTSSCRRPF